MFDLATMSSSACLLLPSGESSGRAAWRAGAPRDVVGSGLRGPADRECAHRDGSMGMSGMGGMGGMGALVDNERMRNGEEMRYEAMPTATPAKGAGAQRDTGRLLLSRVSESAPGLRGQGACVAIAVPVDRPAACAGRNQHAGGCFKHHGGRLPSRLPRCQPYPHRHNHCRETTSGGSANYPLHQARRLHLERCRRYLRM
jgi:hypothetical protein